MNRPVSQKNRLNFYINYNFSQPNGQKEIACKHIPEGRMTGPRMETMIS